MNSFSRETSVEKAERYISDLAMFNQYAQDRLNRDHPDIFRPYWLQVIQDNRVRFEYLKQYHARLTDKN